MDTTTTVPSVRPLPNLCDPNSLDDVPPRDRIQIHGAYCFVSFISIFFPVTSIKAGKIGYEILCVPAFFVTVWGIFIARHIRHCTRPIPRPGVTVRLPPPPLMIDEV
jgi:hypothetical protein